METRFTILLVEIAAALVVQIGILIAVFAMVKKSTARMETLADEFRARALPTLENVQQLIAATRPRLETIGENLSRSTTLLRHQVEKLDTTVSDIVERTRMQVVRADEIISRTLDRVEITTDVVQQTFISPVRQMSGLLSGLTAGLAVIFGRRNSGTGMRAHQQDEMFI